MKRYFHQFRKMSTVFSCNLPPSEFEGYVNITKNLLNLLTIFVRVGQGAKATVLKHCLKQGTLLELKFHSSRAWMIALEIPPCLQVKHLRVGSAS
jgi:hypothetical protein